MLLDRKGGAKEIDVAEARTVSADDGLLWIDIDLASKSGRDWIRDSNNVDPTVASVISAAETRPRSMTMDDGLVVVLRGINMNPGATPDDMVGIRMWVEKNRIITCRRRKVLSISDLRENLFAGTGPRTSGEFLVELTARLSERISAAIDNIDNLLADLDQKLESGTVGEVRQTLGVVRRQAAALRRHLAPQRDALDRLARASDGLLTNTESFELREEGDHLMRHIEDLDLARETALVLQEEMMNQIAQEQNQRMYVLSIVAALFLPLSFITGLLGMNVAGLPGTQNPAAFYWSALIMVGTGIALLAYFKWRRWL